MCRLRRVGDCRCLAQGETGILVHEKGLFSGKDPFPSCEPGPGLSIEESDEAVVVKGRNFSIPFSRSTGLIENAVSNGRVAIESGPYLDADIELDHLSGAETRKAAEKFIVSGEAWRKDTLSVSLTDGKAEVFLSGSYGETDLDILMTVSPDGRIDISYNAAGVPDGYVKQTGLYFILPDAYSFLSWHRKGYWSYYPAGSFAGNRETVPLYNRNLVRYGECPDQPWSMDTHNYYYWADAGADSEKPLTQTAKGLKENIYYYTLSAKGKNAGKPVLSIVSPEAELACRIGRQPEGHLVLHVSDKWDYPEIAWGNYSKKLQAAPVSGNLTLCLNKN